MHVGSLDAPNQIFLVDCHSLDRGSNVNSSIILHTVDDILQQLEIKRENFSMFLTDAARYISFAGKTLNELYPSLMHVNCVVHLLHTFFFYYIRCALTTAFFLVSAIDFDFED